jgi:CRP-like cAMP-binding protein
MKIETGKRAPHVFLSTTGVGRQFVTFRKNATIFVQGDVAESLFFIQKGRVKLSVVSGSGKEAILGILTDNDFLGESALANRRPRMSTATALSDCLMLRIDRKAMNLAMAQDATLASLFVGHLLERNLRHQEDLADQLINPSEKRLARLLMLLAESDGTENIIPKVSQVTLAEMVGTTRSRVSFFLNRFRKLGFIQYKYNARDVLRVNSERLDLVLRDEPVPFRETARVGGNVQSITAKRAKRQTEAGGLKNRHTAPAPVEKFESATTAKTERPEAARSARLAS